MRPFHASPRSLAWRQTQRDFRAGELRLLIVAVMLGVAALTAVGFFADRLKSGLARDAALGGQPLAVPGSYPWGPEAWRAAVSAAWVAAVPLMSGRSMHAGMIVIREREFAFESGELSRLADYGRMLIATMRDSVRPTDSPIAAHEVLMATQ